MAICAIMSNSMKLATALLIICLFGLVYFPLRNIYRAENISVYPVASSTVTNASNRPEDAIHVPITSPATPVVKPAVKFDKTTADLMKEMKLTFNEDFNTFSRYTDGKGNISCFPGGTGIWQTVYHFCSRTIFGNHEAQLYIDDTFLDYLRNQSKATVTTQSPFSINDGVLTIEAKPIEPVIAKAVGDWWAKYTSGLITTQFSFSQTYGYFEMRAKLPKGKGLWPAFWLLPIDKSWPPEIDVMEAFGDKNDRGDGPNTMIHYATHAVDKTQSCGDWYDVGVDITKDFHTYGVLWEPTKMTYYFDGKPYASCPSNKESNQPFYMLVNLAVGSDKAWPTAPNAENVWPAYMNVDYVRAYQYK